MSQCRSAGIHPQERGGDHRRLLRHKYNPLCRQIDQHILEFLISAGISSSPASAVRQQLHSVTQVHQQHQCRWGLHLHGRKSQAAIYLSIPCLLQKSVIHAYRAQFLAIMQSRRWPCLVFSTVLYAPPAAACCQTSHFHDKI